MFLVIWVGLDNLHSHYLILFLVLWLQLVSPGAWLTDMCQERYEVREKKSTKKVSGWYGVFTFSFFSVIAKFLFFF